MKLIQMLCDADARKKSNFLRELAADWTPEMIEKLIDSVYDEPSPILNQREYAIWVGVEHGRL